MTSSILDNVQHWRGRAKAARLVANHLDDPVAKAAMLTIAEQYDRIAEQAQVRSHYEAPKASKGQDGSTAEESRPAENVRGSPRRFRALSWAYVMRSPPEAVTECVGSGHIGKAEPDIELLRFLPPSAAADRKTVLAVEGIKFCSLGPETAGR